MVVPPGQCEKYGSLLRQYNGEMEIVFAQNLYSCVLPFIKKEPVIYLPVTISRFGNLVIAFYRSDGISGRGSVLAEWPDSGGETRAQHYLVQVQADQCCYVLEVGVMWLDHMTVMWPALVYLWWSILSHSFVQLNPSQWLLAFSNK